MKPVTDLLGCNVPKKAFPASPCQISPTDYKQSAERDKNKLIHHARHFSQQNTGRGGTDFRPPLSSLLPAGGGAGGEWGPNKGPACWRVSSSPDFTWGSVCRALGRAGRLSLGGHQPHPRVRRASGGEPRSIPSPPPAETQTGNPGRRPRQSAEGGPGLHVPSLPTPSPAPEP